MDIWILDWRNSVEQNHRKIELTVTLANMEKALLFRGYLTFPIINFSVNIAFVFVSVPLVYILWLPCM